MHGSWWDDQTCLIVNAFIDLFSRWFVVRVWLMNSNSTRSLSFSCSSRLREQYFSFDICPTNIQHRFMKRWMEQQSISITKEGIFITPQARYSVNTVANTVGDRYDPTWTFINEVNLSDLISAHFMTESHIIHRATTRMLHKIMYVSDSLCLSLRRWSSMILLVILNVFTGEPILQEIHHLREESLSYKHDVRQPRDDCSALCQSTSSTIGHQYCPSYCSSNRIDGSHRF